MKAPTRDQLTHAAQLLATAEPEVAKMLTDLACIAGLSESDLQAAYKLMDEQADLAMKGQP